MIDIHTHIIPNIDDGSDSIEETISILKEAEKCGFTDIVATPHYVENYYENDFINVKNSLQNISEYVKQENININLYSGQEIYIMQEISELIRQNKIGTLANSRYILIELPRASKAIYLNYVIKELLSLGLIPIIAHPERYLYIQKRPESLIELVEQGVLFQSNYGSILGRYNEQAKETIEKLLKMNLIHFLASDCHKSNTIYKQIGQSIQKIQKIIGNEKLYELTTINPKKILLNESI